MKPKISLEWTVMITLLLVFLAGCNQAKPVPIVTELPKVTALATLEEVVQQVQNVAASTGEEQLLSLQSAYQKLYADVIPSVVYIQVIAGSQVTATLVEGSGFIWDAKGHVVTNNHVVADALEINVSLPDGTIAAAKLVGADPDSDLAVLKVSATGIKLQPVTLADSQAVKVGDLVIAIGNPYGLSGTMTQGIVSALSRTIAAGDPNLSPTGSYSIPDIIQTDAAINPGNSGGILVDVKGRVVGVTSAIESQSGSNAGIGFVIPSHIVNRVVPVLIEQGFYQHPRLGITGSELTPSLAQANGLDAKQKGILVVDVTPNGPADKAGLVGSNQQTDSQGQPIFVGGDVIIAVDGQKINTFDGLTSYLFNNTNVGQKIMLTILRHGKEQAIQVKLEALS